MLNINPNETIKSNPNIIINNNNINNQINKETNQSKPIITATTITGDSIYNINIDIKINNNKKNIKKDIYKQRQTINSVLDYKTTQVLNKLKEFIIIGTCIQSGKEAEIYTGIIKKPIISKYISNTSNDNISNTINNNDYNEGILHCPHPPTQAVISNTINNNDYNEGIPHPSTQAVISNNNSNNYNNINNNIIIKIYRTSTTEFKNRSQYLTEKIKNVTNTRKLIKMWAEKEMRNLKRLMNVGFSAPIPLWLKRNVLVMEMVSCVFDVNLLNNYNNNNYNNDNNDNNNYSENNNNYSEKNLDSIFTELKGNDINLFNNKLTNIKYIPSHISHITNKTNLSNIINNTINEKTKTLTPSHSYTNNKSLVKLIAPNLKSLTLTYLTQIKTDYNELYNETLKIIKDLYKKAEIVHGDLSEYNLLLSTISSNNNIESYINKIIVIDVSQSISIYHPNSQSLLIKDIKNINTFFSKKGVQVKGDDDIFLDITCSVSDSDTITNTNNISNGNNNISNGNNNRAGNKKSVFDISHLSKMEVKIRRLIIKRERKQKRMSRNIK
ncbi:putative serine/threonine-protein kinase RIO1 like protein [Cucumispora dikerogammari]|nr:putative serine/threonine-protein kinase RIO1 like protein [Cucumispora dikerogammari]